MKEWVPGLWGEYLAKALLSLSLLPPFTQQETAGNIADRQVGSGCKVNTCALLGTSPFPHGAPK